MASSCFMHMTVDMFRNILKSFKVQVIKAEACLSPLEIAMTERTFNTDLNDISFPLWMMLFY